MRVAGTDQHVSPWNLGRGRDRRASASCRFLADKDGIDPDQGDRAVRSFWMTMATALRGSCTSCKCRACMPPGDCEPILGVMSVSAKPYVAWREQPPFGLDPDLNPL